MEPARKRGRSEMWDHFNLIAHDKVGQLQYYSYGLSQIYIK